MDEFQKIDLESKIDSSPIISRDKEPMARTTRKTIPKALVIFLVFVILVSAVSIFAVVLPLQKAYKSASATYQQAKKVVDGIKTQNIATASTELTKTKDELTVTQRDLHALSYMRFIPLVNNYYNDADHLVNAGFHGITAGEILVDSVKPYADVLGLKGQGSFVMGSAEQRIQTAVLTMGKITPRIDELAGSLQAVQKEVDAVDPNHYPAFLGGEKIKKQLATLRTLTDEGVLFVNEARPLIKVLPQLLGESKEKKYLVLFQNDKELRPTGGFITAYAIFRIDRGIIKVERSDDIYNLDKVPNPKKAPDPILKYLPKVTTFNLRDSNLSPDYIVSMKTFQEMYNTVPGKVDVDGIIAVDTHVLVTMIKILDDKVEAGGISFNTKIDKRCDCPQVIFELEDNISRPVGYIKSDRKGLLGDIMFAIMQKALKSSPKVYWGPLFQAMIAEINQKHVLFAMVSPDAQSGLEALNAAGRIKSYDGDYLHINQANFSGAKTNLYLKESVEQQYDVATDGSITKTITMNLKDPYPPSDCNLERGGLCLNSIHRDWFRIYVPKGSTLLDSTGSEVKVTTYEDLGKTVFDGFVSVRPLGAATVTLKYKLPFKVAAGSLLPLLVQKQPGTDANAYTIKVNGHQLEKFDLLTDREFKLKI